MDAIVEAWRVRGSASPVEVRSRNAAPAHRGEIFVEALSDKARAVRSAKGLAIAWGLAVVSVFIPIANFVLVPAFLIAGPIVAHWRYRQAAVRLGGVAKCPDCGAALRISGGPATWPLHEGCTACGAVVDVVAA